MFLDQVIFDKTKVPALNAVLDVTQLRHRVIANNIANISTKGYRAKEVRFQDYLASFVKEPAVQSQTTDARHVSLAESASQLEVFEPETELNDSGLNNVNIEKEMVGMGENHLLFNAGSALIRGQFSSLRKSITGRTQ